MIDLYFRFNRMIVRKDFSSELVDVATSRMSLITALWGLFCFHVASKCLDKDDHVLADLWLARAMVGTIIWTMTDEEIFEIDPKQRFTVIEGESHAIGE